MKTLCCISDCHLGYMHLHKKERAEDYEKAFAEAVEKAMAEKPDMIIFGGDLSHHTKPDPRSLKILINTFMEIAAKTKVVICVGNHEQDGHLKTAYTPLFSDLHENIHVLTTENPHIVLEVGGKRIGLHGFEYIRNKELAEETLKKISSELSAPTNKADVNILCIHQGAEGYLPPYAPYEISIKALKEAASKYDLVLIGHVHKHKKIKEISTPAYYIGATERVSFNEAENATGFLVFRDCNFANPQFVEVSSSPMRRIEQSIGRKTPQEINAHIKRLVEENSDVKCLQIDLEADVAGDYFEIKQDLEEAYPGFTILKVGVSQTIKDEIIRIEKTQIDRSLIDEYFEKKGMGDRSELKDACVRFYEKYGA